MDMDENLNEIGYLDYLLEKTPAKTRFRLLKSNFDLWKGTFPVEASILVQDQAVASQNDRSIECFVASSQVYQ